ncbi:glycoside hydrolase family 7 protein [Aplosporella prunicola CBS 121167]|uniref:Glucanase n=1 Tax=Aplosporella prunicola CBS 121167 TaxID=1176127 RepID=A0A6A6AWH9_9PEZI|nr:glycoside hydrolase family 7 protein [Aplosporella prunicola CBS 121167]KAF2136299.1 glycoside hydrolase family 7 protein [Aplosporella prunicola CBS 121167]
MITPALLTVFAAMAAGQQVGTQKAEVHPSMSWQQCTSSGCTTKNGKVVIDSNWRWVHTVDGYTNCYTGNKWDESICSTNEDCATKCALDGADYQATYGATASGDSLKLQFVTQSQTKNIGSRLYMMADDDTYELFKPLNKEFTFDVDVSNLPCGLNGALYMVAMDADGGKSKYTNNAAGAKYGTGYCDAQCPRDLKFINGMGNVEGWTPSDNDENAGVGDHGSCCAEMDIWEANKISTAYTPHACTNAAQHICDGDNCGGTYSATRYAGDCDPDGCDFNSYRMGDTSFYGEGKTVDTKSKFTVVTQFITADGTDNGALSEIRRFYVQGGKVIPNSVSTVSGAEGNAVNDAFCKAQKTAFGDRDTFNEKGGFSSMTTAMKAGMALVMSLWDDHEANMLWLDSTYPIDSTSAGAARGTCETTSGVPAEVERDFASSSVTYSAIKFGSLNSTFAAA